MEQHNVTLFEENSVEDLLLRGFGDVSIRRITGVSMRLHKQTFLKKINNIDTSTYCGLHVKSRIEHCVVEDILYKYANDMYNLHDVRDAIGIGYKKDHECPLSDVFVVAGYASLYESAASKRASIIRNKIATTNQLKYGGSSPMASESVRNKVKETTLDRFGVDNVSKLDSVKKKRIRTTEKHYGVQSPLQSNAVLEKRKETVQMRYGVDNVSKLDEVKKKKADTTYSHFGVTASSKDPIVRAKMAESLRRHYGIKDTSVEYPFQIQEVLEKSRNTCERRYGVRNPFAIDEVKSDIRDHWLYTHGVTNPSQVKEIQEKRRQTMLDRFGVENAFLSDTIKEKIKATNVLKYGVPYVSQNKEIRERGIRTKIESGTINSSKPEDDLYGMLASEFGSSDVIRQHYSSQYPFACDFYIKSRDMYIELNASWTHGHHWFCDDNENDLTLISEWNNAPERYYRIAAHTWSHSDVQKRSIADKNHLNYVVFWRNDLYDAVLWFLSGCPDACDFTSEYSWLPERKFNDSINARACKIWNENPHLKYDSFQMDIYVRCYKKLHRRPDELTDKEIMQQINECLKFQ